ncbi:DUF4012 domain-containing protein [Candidatus Falkowbacteria bacterium]|uniref:DUF4012 domain-containing protein n=1 Tax=Candidatus Falkowbacteria bacterium CG10_big_fil_rev_8_21_14_0_10_37_18 TaxID=1974562 RepID=A0A2H0VC11_9BACT|nr:DUF4012 domain-containing protein [Candidatus Falkowbacteria bacterium]NCQ12797.1 DUF4012 domain-containing protein [Candidatus Falkowbacteria bacterium]PIQ80280.1 MAG: hypothetical protein COV79_01330 [Parcubacteria group bacterium CG11_big_fil_rev_8_21_14_0_20_41_14]PIR95889.1 MAG: hypothetical protein COT93_00080 [Candidatus Falkowbacteria bacterium CG10_big_fil_rev_8_21_14_0_10_37_18]
MHYSSFFRFIGSLLKYIGLAIAAFVIILAVLLFGAYNDLKEAALNGWNGKTAISAAAAAISTQNWELVSEQSQLADEYFTAGIDNLARTQDARFIKNIGLIKTQINDLAYLLKVGEILSSSLTHLSPIIAKLDNVRASVGVANFNDLPESNKREILQLIYESEPELNGLQANLDLAILNLDKIHKLGILWPAYERISSIKNEMKQIAVLFNKFSPLLKMLPALTGYPDTSHFLLILQNNDELRPSGGFIGVYGLLDLKNGSIKELSTSDSYHLDAPASINDNWNLEPPVELKKYLDVKKWYLRDANWSPDWPSSAQQIEKIYRGENLALGNSVPPFTAIIAITPDLVSDLIRLTGPITVGDTTYTADNLQPLLQYNVEVAYKEDNISSWDRKAVINELISELQKKLSALSSSRWRDLFSLVSNNIDAKNIQVYFSQEDRENLVKRLGAGGEVKNSDGDYLLVVDANLGAFKSDVAVKKNIYYFVTKNSNSLQASLRLSYRHEGAFDWRTTRYRSYTRVYAPLGSKFVSLQGLDESTRDLKVVDDKGLNKTVFGFFLTVEPGTDREIVLDYQLPDNIYKLTTPYQLLVQNQAGNRIESLNINFQDYNKPAQVWASDLKTDKTFTVK